MPFSPPWPDHLDHSKSSAVVDRVIYIVDTVVTLTHVSFVTHHGNAATTAHGNLTVHNASFTTDLVQMESLVAHILGIQTPRLL